MEGFLKSFGPFWNKYRAESILLASAAVLAILSAAFFSLEKTGGGTLTEEYEPAGYSVTKTKTAGPQIIYADIAGAGDG